MNHVREGGSGVHAENSILIVDDTVANLLAFSAILKKLGCRIVTAASGLEAITFAEQENFDVVLMDIRMPVMDGFETAQRLRKMSRTQKTPILFLSAHLTPPVHMFSQFVGGSVDFLPSPVDTEALLLKVGALLQASRGDSSDPNLQKTSLEGGGPVAPANA